MCHFSILQLYRLLQYGGDIDTTRNLVFSVGVRMLSVTNIVVRSFLNARDGNMTVNLLETITGILLSLPSTVTRWFISAVILVTLNWLGHILLGILLLVYFFLAALLTNNAEATIRTVFTAFSSPFLYIKDFDTEHETNKRRKNLKSYYCMNKLVTIPILLIFLLTCLLITHQTTDDGQDIDKVIICEWMNNITLSVNYSMEIDYVTTQRSCALSLFYPVLLALALFSLIDAIATAVCKYSPSNFILFHPR